MQLWKTLKIAGFFTLATSSLSALAADSPATVPASLQGTYSMTFDASSNTAPFKDNESVTVVVMPNNQICVAGLLLTNPVIRNGNPHEAIWTHASSKIEVALSSLVSGFNEINLQQGVLATPSFIFHGQLRGQKTSSATTCSAAPPAPTISASAQSMFDLAAELYPTLFGGGGALGTVEGYVYRFFPISGIYIGIKDDIVYTLGGPFGNTITAQANVAAVLKSLQDAKQQNNNPTPSGLYNLKISGSVSLMGFLTTIPEITITGTPVLRPTDTSGLADTVKNSFAGVSGFAVSKVTVINDTANRSTFRIEATASQAGVTVIYDLLYDYTK